MTCQRCRTIRASHAYRTLAETVVTQEPICWLRLDGCTRRTTTADHITPLHADHNRALERTNLHGACHSCNTRRAQRGLHATAALAATPKPRRPRKRVTPPPPPQAAPALAWFNPAAPPRPRKNQGRKHNQHAITLAARW
jgi:5-methylcytosine-specific restriction endonuclease McrA